MAPERVEPGLEDTDDVMRKYWNQDGSPTKDSLSPSLSPRTPESVCLSPFQNPSSPTDYIKNEKILLAKKYFGSKSEGDMHDELICKIQKMSQQTDDFVSVQNTPKLLITDEGKYGNGIEQNHKEQYQDREAFTSTKFPLNDERQVRQSDVKGNVNEHEEHSNESRPNNKISKDITNLNAKVNIFPIKLPFLDEIKKLRRNDETYATDSFKTLNNVTSSTNESHANHAEIKQKKVPLPFLSDIKNLGKFKTQTKECYSTSVCFQKNPEFVYVKETIAKKIAEYNEKREERLFSPTLECFIENNDKRTVEDESMEETNENDLCQNSGLQNLKHILTENKQLTQKKVTFSPDTKESVPDEEIFTKKNNPKDNYESKHEEVSKIKAKLHGKLQIKIDENTNMSKIADHIIPQLNEMQKNYLGLLFFNELSENIVEDIVAQELSRMEEPKMESLITNLDPKVCNTAAPILLNSVTEELRTLLVCDAFDELKIQEKAALVFTAGKDAIDVCSHVGEYGGREFKKSLIRSLLEKEDRQFRAELIQEMGKDQRKINTVNEILREKICQNSEDEENYSSAEETL